MSIGLAIEHGAWLAGATELDEQQPDERRKSAECETGSVSWNRPNRVDPYSWHLAVSPPFCFDHCPVCCTESDESVANERMYWRRKTGGSLAAAATTPALASKMMGIMPEWLDFIRSRRKMRGEVGFLSTSPDSEC